MRSETTNYLTILQNLTSGRVFLNLKIKGNFQKIEDKNFRYYCSLKYSWLIWRGGKKKKRQKPFPYLLDLLNLIIIIIIIIRS